MTVPPKTEAWLAGVDAVSTDDVWAIGDGFSANDGVLPFTAHWDGTRWSVGRDAASGRPRELSGVTAVSGDDVWAVGFRGDRADDSKPRQGIAEHWDGRRWSAAPMPKGNFELQAVAAVSSGDVWTVGLARNQNGDVTRPVIEHWDGTRWRYVASPDVRGGWLNSIAAVTPRDVWAAGGVALGGSLLEHWDGNAWRVVPTRLSGSLRESTLYGIGAVSSRDIWAAGGHPLDSRTDQSFVMHWNGSSWRLVPDAHFVGTDGGGSAFASVAAESATDVWVVGYQFEHWNGRRWNVTFTPPVGSADAVSALSSTDVWAVGENGRGPASWHYRC